jgi:hypothetical protein
VTACAVLAFALSDPERRIAERDVARYQSTGRLDAHYLATLGPDAAPVLARACLPARRPAPDGPASFNLARLRARHNPAPAPHCA